MNQYNGVAAVCVQASAGMLLMLYELGRRYLMTWGGIAVTLRSTIQASLCCGDVRR